LRAGHGAEIARAFEHHAFAKPAATSCSSSAGWWSRAGPPCSPRTCSSPRYTNDSATVDRLRHNAYCLTLDGASYRAPRQGPNRAKNALASTPKNIDS